MGKGYSLSYKIVQLPVAGLWEKYGDEEKYLALCKECPNYNTLWSCPPLAMNKKEFLARFSHITLVGAKMTLDVRLIEKTTEPDDIKKVSWDILLPEKETLRTKLLAIEEKVPGSVSLSSGGCSICKECARPAGKPCRFPDKMRHSLDSLGFDLSAISRDLLDSEIIWCHDRLPDYYSLIHALLTPTEITDNALWQETFGENLYF